MKNEINKSLLRKIVETTSLSGETNQCLKTLKLIEMEIKKKNIPVFIDFNKGIPFLIAGNLDKASILFLSHIDVVPAKIDSFLMKEKDGKLFGRGVLDMKGPLVSSLEAFIRLRKNGRENIVFVVTSDEEIGGFNGTAFLVKNIFKNIEMAIISDSSGEDLVIVQKAPFHIKVFAKGKSAHGSRPWEGKNAAENLLKCCLKIIKNVNGTSHNQTSAAITQFHSGETTNKIPDKAEATIDIRIEKESEIEELIKKIKTVTKDNQCNWEKIDEPMFFEISPNNLFIKKWQKIFKKITGKKTRLKVECGASDARFLWQELKIPIIITSAIGGGAHSDEEWVEINSLNRLSETIVKFINSL